MNGRFCACILTLTCAVLVVRVATGSAVPSTRLGLHFESFGVVPVAIRDAAIAEAARIWLPYGVVVHAIEGLSAPCAEGDLSIGVFFDLEPTADEVTISRSGSEGLGSVHFAPDGAPLPSATIHYGAVTRIATSGRVEGLEAWQWPEKLRDQVVARAVGRVLAHELGHFLLRWPHHADAGLMRGEFRASTLADPDPGAFSLTNIDRARFQIVLDAALPPVAARTEAVQATTCRPGGLEAVAGIQQPR